MATLSDEQGICRFVLLLRPAEQTRRSPRQGVAYADRVSRIVTTEWVLIEVADGLAGSRHRHMFSETRQELLADENVEIVPLQMALYEEGVALYASRLDKQWSLTDCLSFVVMERSGLTEALTADQHSEQAGFLALLR